MDTIKTEDQEAASCYAGRVKVEEGGSFPHEEDMPAVTSEFVEVKCEVYDEEDCAQWNTVGSQQTDTSSPEGVPCGVVDQSKKRKQMCKSRELRKKHCNENQSYVSSAGKVVPCRTFVSDLSCGCKKKCTEVVGAELRHNLFSEFWGSGSFSGRCAIINAHVKETKKARTYTKNKASRRTFSRKYYIAGTEVCTTTFMKTLQITQDRVGLALRKSTAAVVCDERGTKSGGRNKLTEREISQICAHIDSVPSDDAQFSEVYRMYKLYKQQSSNNCRLVSFATYKKIFYKHQSVTSSEQSGSALL